MRTDRLPQKATQPHTLVTRTPGKNRFLPGVYLCSCGQHFTGMNTYETHRAVARARLKGKPDE